VSGLRGRFPSSPPIPARSASCPIARLLPLAWRCPPGAPPVCVQLLCFCLPHAVCALPVSLVTSSVARLTTRREAAGRSKRNSRPVSHPLESVRCFPCFCFDLIGDQCCPLMHPLACPLSLSSDTCATTWPTRGPSRALCVRPSYPRPFRPRGFLAPSVCLSLSPPACSCRWQMAIPTACMGPLGGLASGAHL